MNQTRINYLLKQFASGALTHAEHEELNNLLAQPNRDELVQYIVNLAQAGDPPPSTIADISTDASFEKIIAADKAIPLKKRTTSFRWLSAAALLLLALAALLYFMRPSKPTPMPVAVTIKPEKAPGRNVATLRLADNTIVELDSLGNRIIGTQGGSNVLLQNGRLAYTPGENTSTTTTYNTITTPRGGEFMLTLPDGTKVWLNAASSLTFPTAFTESKRTVKLTGEAYLEVAEDKQHPFEVAINNATISVLGTEFNVNDYEDEDAAKVTLVKGKVEVSSGKQLKVLEPGQHALIDATNPVRVAEANIEEETAWKNGRIFFTNANIKKIMRQVSRWYDVDIAYEENTTNLDFTCTVSRKDKLSRLLHLLELTGSVKFTMKQNTLYVH